MVDFEVVANQPAVVRARQLLRETDDTTLADLLELTAIPAPPFGEGPRAERMRERFLEIGLPEVTRDAAGNVLATWAPPGATGAPLILAAHLDTVFPADTEIHIREENGCYRAPGVADNGRGLAALLALARAAVAVRLPVSRPVVFVATVGEEGVGDLRGVKHLFRAGSRWRDAAGFIALDGTGSRRIVNRGVGSRRLRLVLRGPGGHSWADWGTVNPAHALGLVIAEAARLRPPRQPRTTVTVARVGGGTSVNAIPQEARLELDLRSEENGALAEVEQRMRAAVRGAVGEVNARRRRGTPSLGFELELIGDRPGGETPARSWLVRAARAATRAIGRSPELVASSTDANLPMSLGIPAIALGAGGESGGTHTTAEWYGNEGGVEGIERLLLTVAAVAGVRAAERQAAD